MRSGGSELLGLLKVGRKQLFFYDRSMQTYHGKVLCVLDFYVHHKRQREGIGKHLFDFMLTVRVSIMPASAYKVHTECILSAY